LYPVPVPVPVPISPPSSLLAVHAAGLSAQPLALTPDWDPASEVPVVSADSEPGPVLADDLLKLGGVLRQARNIPDQYKIREASCHVRQDLPAPT
jgi:hypothetical protein